MPAPLPSRLAALAVAGLAFAAPVRADGPADNKPDNVRPIPPKGVAVPPADLDALKAALTAFKAELDSLPAALAGKPALLDLIPDAEVYHKAVRYSVDDGTFYNPKEVDAAKQLLKQGMQRAKELKAGTPSWPTATGLVVRGYRSKIDGSVQPYGLVVPKDYAAASAAKHRLDFWWHGRGETLTEVNFIADRQRSPGEFTPAGAFVLHPYGRYCNANKFAGEVDTFECLEHAKKHYRIDENRIVARGFSMGGAACWQFATHFPTLWCAAAPGAGFAETPEFLNNFQGEAVKPTWYEQKLWHLYNATDYAQNIANLPTVAYSGEIDKQKQAADVMAREMMKLDPPIPLTHVIGPKTAHKYEPGAKAEVNRLIDAIAEKGRSPFPEYVNFQTYTLRYNRSAFVTVDRLEKHWEPATVTVIAHPFFSPPRTVFPGWSVTTKNVSAFTVSFGPGEAPWARLLNVDSDGPDLGNRASDQSLTSHFLKRDGHWVRVDGLPSDGLAKKHGLQGPIDDAFLDEFHVYGPSGPAANEKIGTWVDAESKRFVREWHRHFRGDVTMHPSDSFAWNDVVNGNLILWGDPSSNKVIAEVVKKLPIKWTADAIEFGGKTYDAKTHVPVLIYPNPFNPKKYVVINSGFTFREYDYLNNARQVPKLPDYAVVDVTTPPDSRAPGKVVRAGFFGEKWEWLPDDGK